MPADQRSEDAVSWWSVLSVLLPAAVLLWIGVDGWDAWRRNTADPGQDERINCDIQNTPCTRPIGSGRVRLDIEPRPVRAMVEQRFRVVLENVEIAEAPHIDLNMPDMEMGYNRVFLEPAGNGVYTGTGIFVVCPSGIPTWSAEVAVPGAGTAEFIFDVRY